MNFNQFALSLILVAIVVVPPTPTLSKAIQKRSSFSALGCLGFYDHAMFSQLEGVCYDCFQMYKKPEVESMCRSNCFRNDIFNDCVDALSLQHLKQDLLSMVSKMYGK